MTLSLLLMSGLISGPASAFLLARHLLWILLIAPLAGTARMGFSWLGRLAVLELVPLAMFLFGILLRDEMITDRCLRWALALASGFYFAGELGTARMARILGGIAERSGCFKVFFNNLSLMVSLAGPYARTVRKEFRERIREGGSYMNSVEQALTALPRVEPDCKEELTGEKGFLVPGSFAAVTWLLMLSCISRMQVYF